MRSECRYSLTAALTVRDIGNYGRGTEFRGREGHLLEQAARVFHGRHFAFLFGNTVFHRGDEILRRAFDPHDGEEAEGNKEDVGIVVVGEIARERCADTIRDLIHRTAAEAAARFVRFDDAGVQDDRVDRLKNGDRERVGDVRLHRIAAAEAGRLYFTLENTDVPFTAEENNFLFDDGDTFEFLHIARSDAGFEGDLYVNFDKELIKPAVERYRVDVNARPHNLRALCTDDAGAVNDILTDTGQIHPHIFKTVFIAAGVEDPIGVDAHKVPVTSACISAFSHFVFHAFRMN